jgi:AhpD family alkylhydroperoxidase
MASLSLGTGGGIILPRFGPASGGAPDDRPVKGVHMARDEARVRRSQELPIVGGLPDVPGIGVAMRLTPALGVHLRGLADALLVDDYPGATIHREDRELLATAVSAANDCFFCMDSHGAFATALMQRGAGASGGVAAAAPALPQIALVEEVKLGGSEGFDPKMQSLLHIARTVRHDPLALTEEDIATASAAGASNGDVQLAVLIASGFSMYNRLVDGFRAVTPASPEAYAERAGEIAQHGYSAPRPGAAASQRG